MSPKSLGITQMLSAMGTYHCDDHDDDGKEEEKMSIVS